jgi:hypothetical protein
MQPDSDREQQEIDALLAALDSPAPQVDPELLAAEARLRGRPGTPSHAIRWAAAVLLLLGVGGIAYAIPGSPLRGLVQRVVEAITGQGNEAPSSPALPSQAPSDNAGIAVTPGERFSIVFTGRAGGHALVRLADGARVTARSSGASFTSEEMRLLIEIRDSAAVVELELPRSAPRVEIIAGDRRLFTKAGSQVSTTSVPAADGTYRLELAPP